MDKISRFIIERGQIAIFCLGLASAILFLFMREWGAVAAIVALTWFLMEVWRGEWTKSGP